MTERTNEQRRGIGGIDPRAAAWLAWSLWALSVALTALSLLLLALIRSHPGTHIFDWWLGNATQRNRRDRWRHRGLPPTREPRGLVLVSLGTRRQHEHLYLAVRHLCPAGRAQLAPGRRSDGLDRRVDAAHHDRAPGGLFDVVSYWTSCRAGAGDGWRG